MDSREFLESYKPALAREDGSFRDTAVSELLDEQSRKLGEESHGWANHFGRLLGAVLDADTYASVEDDTDFSGYQAWCFVHGAQYMEALFQHRNAHAINSDEFNAISRELQHYSFHLVNMWFGPLWQRALNQAAAPSHIAALDEVQRNTAFGGTWFNLQRERKIESQGLEEYLYAESLGDQEPSYSDRTFMEGLLAELDTATVLLELARKESWLILPGPPQFESLTYRANIDFVVVDGKRQRSAGVQVKNTVTPADVQRYDQERVVLVDSNVDLDGRRTERVVTARNIRLWTFNWAGLICLERFAEYQLDSEQEQEYGGLQLFAHSKIRGFSKALPRAAAILEKRIKAKL